MFIRVPSHLYVKLIDGKERIGGEIDEESLVAGADLHTAEWGQWPPLSFSNFSVLLSNLKKKFMKI